MWKKITTIVILLLLVLVVVFAIYTVWQNLKSKKQANEEITLRDYFPFGKNTKTAFQEIKDKIVNQEEEPVVTEITKKPRLRKITNNPVSGFIPIIKEIPINPDEIPEPIVKTVTPQGILTKDLKLGSRDPEVKILQQTLNLCPETTIALKGSGSLGQETETFSTGTLNSLIRLQTRFKDQVLVPQNQDKATGILDQQTRDILNKPFNCEKEKTATILTIKKPMIRYLERQNGNIYDATTDTLDTKRISNTTIPRIEDALFVNNGDSVILRYLRDNNKTIETFLAKLPDQLAIGGDSLPELTGVFLDQDIYDLSISPDTKQIFYLLPSSDGMFGFVQDLITQRKTKVVTSTLRGWITSWSNKTIAITSKATGYATSSMFSLNTYKETPISNRIVGGIYGMATLPSPDGEKILYSRTNSSGIGLIVYNIKDNKYIDLETASMVEKCTWDNDSIYIYCGVPISTPTAVYPDNWYQSEIAFRDTLWKIDSTGIFGNKEIEDISSSGEEDIDVTKITVDNEKKYLYFINKNNLSFWQFDLENI